MPSNNLPFSVPRTRNNHQSPFATPHHSLSRYNTTAFNSPARIGQPNPQQNTTNQAQAPHLDQTKTNYTNNKHHHIHILSNSHGSIQRRSERNLIENNVSPVRGSYPTPASKKSSFHQQGASPVITTGRQDFVVKNLMNVVKPQAPFVGSAVASAPRSLPSKYAPDHEILELRDDIRSFSHGSDVMLANRSDGQRHPAGGAEGDIKGGRDKTQDQPQLAHEAQVERNSINSNQTLRTAEKNRDEKVPPPHTRRSKDGGSWIPTADFSISTDYVEGNTSVSPCGGVAPATAAAQLSSVPRTQIEKATSANKLNLSISLPSQTTDGATTAWNNPVTTQRPNVVGRGELSHHRQNSDFYLVEQMFASNSSGDKSSARTTPSSAAELDNKQKPSDSSSSHSIATISRRVRVSIANIRAANPHLDKYGVHDTLPEGESVSLRPMTDDGPLSSPHQSPQRRHERALNPLQQLQTVQEQYGQQSGDHGYPDCVDL